MNVLIVGAGVVGEALAEQLSQEGHRVSVLDHDGTKAQRLSERLDVLAVCGEAGSLQSLERAGIEKAEMLIAVTDSDEVNIVVGMLAARLGVKHRIVRIRNREFCRQGGPLPLGELGIEHVINPEPTIVEALEYMMAIPGSSDFAKLAGGQVLMLGFDITEDSPLAGRSMQQLRELGDLDAFLVLYITRGDDVIVPRGTDSIQAGDNVHLLVSADTLHFVPSLVHSKPRKVRNVIVTGASRIGVEFAKRAAEKGEQVFLVEPRREIAEEVAGQYRNFTVLGGEPTDLEVLQEANLEKCDLFCALSDDEQQNMMAALLAKRHSQTATAAVVNQPEYVPVMDSLGIDIVLNPRLVTVGEILMHVRRGHVHSVTRLAESRAEIIELEVEPGAPGTKAPLKELNFPRSALVGAVIRDGVMKIPSGDTVLHGGDVVVVFALPQAIRTIEKIFTRR